MVNRREFLFADVAMLRVDLGGALSLRLLEVSGANTLGVVNSGFRRSVRIPVSQSTASARSARAAVRSRAAACTLRRRAMGSGRYASAMARWKRSRSSAGTPLRSSRFEAIDSSSSVAERRLSRNVPSSVFAGAEAQLLLVSCKTVTLGSRELTCLAQPAFLIIPATR